MAQAQTIPSLKSFSGLKSLGSQLMAGFSKHDHMTLAGALAFYTILSLAPLILIILSVVGLLGQSSQNELMNQINGVLGSQAGSAISTVIENADDKPKTGTIAGWIGLVVLLFTASGVFAQLQSSLNTIFEASAKVSSGVWGWIRKRLLSMGMVITIGFIAMVSLVVSAALALLLSKEGVIWQFVNFAVSLGVFSLLFGVMFKFLPDTHLNWRHAFVGGLVTSILFSIGKTLIGLYLGKSAVGSAYGAAGSLVVLLVWVYYSAIILFVGAEITRILAHRHELPATEKETDSKQKRYSRPLRPGLSPT